MLHSEKETADQIWSALPEERPNRSDVQEFLRKEGLTGEIAEQDVVYAYAEGPRESGSAVQAEWYLEFQFHEDVLVQVGIEKRLIGP